MTIGRGAVAVTLSNTVNIPKNDAGNWPIALRFGTGGTASILCADGTTVVIPNIGDRETLPVSAVRVNVTGSSDIADVTAFYP